MKAVFLICKNVQKKIRAGLKSGFSLDEDEPAWMCAGIAGGPSGSKVSYICISHKNETERNYAVILKSPLAIIRTAGNTVNLFRK